jgi:hypothetical protein
MDAGISPARGTRAHHRHELGKLTYVTLDQANGGIVRNLTRNGIGLQVVAAVHPRQQLRVRFELREPRVRVETRGEVMWSTMSGQCGIRFLDLSPRTERQIQQWIFGDLLEGISQHGQQRGSIFAEPGLVSVVVDSPGSPADAEEDDGLILSATPRKVIELPARPDLGAQSNEPTADDLDWLSQPLSGQSLVWTINALVVVAGLLLFAVVFLSVTRQPPPWPMVAAALGLVTGMYWAFFQMFGGSSLGTRLARLIGGDEDDEAQGREVRFR